MPVRSRKTERHGHGELLLHTHTLLVLTLLLWVEQNGYTALYWAAHNNYLEMAQLLLATKAAVDVQDKVRAACRWPRAVF